MAQAKVLDANGSVSTTEVDLSSFGEKARHRLLRVAALRYQANQRQGTHSTKTRAEVARTGRKPYRQKGTGRARAGDFKSPIWRGGGTIFGPRPRSYRKDMSTRARREALRSALFTKFRDEQVVFLKAAWDKPSTKSAAQSLQQLGAHEGGAVVVLPSANETMLRSFRNLPTVDVVQASDVNALDVLSRRNVVFMDNALELVQARLTLARAKGDDA